ncbi:MAG: LacI family DNA-binding transcriptional regulator [Spirochaetota bacterium]
MATIKDVARLAGVSTTTVSRVLNKGAASEATTKKVLRAVAELDYQVNVSARGLAQQSASTVGVIVADISNPPISQMFRGIVERLHAAGLTVMLGNSESNPRKELDLIQMFAVQRSRGVIYTGATISDALCDALNAFPGPVVVAAQQHARLRHPVVLFDNRRASHAVTSHIASHGHHRIGFISGPLSDPEAGAARRHGYLDGLVDAGLAPDETFIEQAEFSVESGSAAMQRLLERATHRPTAVYAASDLIAIGAMKHLQNLGLAVPGDVSVFGFDNIPVGEHLVPSLSTVELDFHELGEVCADLLHRIIGRRRSQVERVVFGHRIIVRESFAPRRGDRTIVSRRADASPAGGGE